MTIDEKAAEPYSNGAIQIANRAEVYPDDEKMPNADPMKKASKEATVASHTWVSKMHGEQLQATKTINITNPDHVYDLTSGSMVKEQNPPSSYQIKPGASLYSVVVNRDGDWDVSGATIQDNLGTNYLASADRYEHFTRFAGYVQINVYDRIEANTSTTAQVQNLLEQNPPKATYWVKIDDMTSYSFKGEQLGLTGSDAYILTYYGMPSSSVTGWGTADISNNINMTGTVVGYGGKPTLNGIYTSTSSRVVEPGIADPTKEAWFYDPDDKSFDKFGLNNGALYWVIEQGGTKIGKGSNYQDQVENGGTTSVTTKKISDGTDISLNNVPMMLLRNSYGQYSYDAESFVGVYFGDLGVNEDGTDKHFADVYKNVDEMNQGIERGELIPIDNSAYQMLWNWDHNDTNTEGQDTKYEYYRHVRVYFKDEMDIPTGKKVYIVLRAEPAKLPEPNTSQTYTNRLRFRHDSMTNNTWKEDTAKQSIHDNSSGIRKSVGGIYEISHNGNTAIVKDIEGNTLTQTDRFTGQDERHGPFRLTVNKDHGAVIGKQDQNYDLRVNSDTDKAKGDGTYITWLISGNATGELDGKFTIIDTLPEGVHLSYVRVYSASGSSSGYGWGDSKSNYKTMEYAGSGVNSATATTNPSFNDNGPWYIFSSENSKYEEDGWEKHVVSAHPADLNVDRSIATVNYYTKDNQIAIDTKFIKGNDPIVYQVVCKVDSDAMNPFEDQFYNNQVTLYDEQGHTVDERGAEAMIGAKSANKAALAQGLATGTVNSAVFPYEIVVNGDAVDMSPDSDVITVPLIDVMTSNLTLSNESLMIFKGSAGTDDAPAYENLIYYGGTYSNAPADKGKPWYTNDSSKVNQAVGNISKNDGTTSSIRVAVSDAAVDDSGNPIYDDESNTKQRKSISFFDLPDSTKLVIKYNVIANLSSSSSNSVSNKAYWKGHEKNMSGETDSDEVYYEVTASASVNTHGAVQIVKFDSSDENVRLPGAEFALYRAAYKQPTAGHLLWTSDASDTIKSKRYLAVFQGGDIHEHNENAEVTVERNSQGNIENVWVIKDLTGTDFDTEQIPSKERVKMKLTDALKAGYYFHHDLDLKDGKIQVYYDEPLAYGTTDENGMLTYGFEHNFGQQYLYNANGEKDFLDDSLEDKIHFNKIYAVVETAAPDGYELNPEPHFFVIPKATDDMLTDGDLQSGSYFNHEKWPDGVNVVTTSSKYDNKPTYVLNAANDHAPLKITKNFDGSLSGANGTFDFGVWLEADISDPTPENCFKRARLSYNYNTEDFGWFYYNSTSKKYSVYQEREDGWYQAEFSLKTNNEIQEGTWLKVTKPNTDSYEFGILPGREPYVEFKNLPYGKYYVFELNDAGYPIVRNGTIGGKHYTVTISGDANSSGEINYAKDKDNVYITNTYYGINVKKQFADIGGNILESGLVGTYTFGLWKADNNGARVGDMITSKTVTWATGDTMPDQTINFNGLEADTKYCVFELDADGKPIDGSTVLSSGGKKFAVSYGTPATNIVVTESHSPDPEVVVTNRATVKLPKTGGIGTKRYTISGILLIAIACLIYGFKMRRSFGRRLNK